MRKTIYLSTSKPEFKQLAYTGTNGLYSSVRPDQSSEAYLMSLVAALGYTGVDPSTLHCTIMYSKDGWPKKAPGCDPSRVYEAEVVKVQYWSGHDNKGYITAALKCPHLHREHRRLRELGCIPTFDYNPHITLYSGVSEEEFERRRHKALDLCGKTVLLTGQAIGDLKDPVKAVSTSSLTECHVRDLRAILDRMLVLTERAENIIKTSNDVFPASRAFWLRDLKRALGLIPAPKGASLADTVEFCERMLSVSHAPGELELTALDAGKPVPAAAVRLRQAALERLQATRIARLKNAARQSDVEALKELTEYFDEIDEKITLLKRIRTAQDRQAYDAYIAKFVSGS